MSSHVFQEKHVSGWGGVDVGGGNVKDDEKQEYDSESERYPYSLPPPPKSWLFAGLGYGYGIGCVVGPAMGIGVGVTPSGVTFGGGPSAFGAFCGVGVAVGGLGGHGNAYVPFGFNTSFSLAPRFIMFEKSAELWRKRNRERGRRQANSTEPQVNGLRDFFGVWWTRIRQRFNG